MPGGSLLLLSEGAGMTAKKKTVIGYVLASLAIIAAASNSNGALFGALTKT